MADDPESPRRTDRVLLLEALMVVVLITLFVYLFLIPSARSDRPAWWTGLLLGGLFFGILGLDAWRRRRRQKQDLRSALRQARTVRPDEEPPVPHA